MSDPAEFSAIRQCRSEETVEGAVEIGFNLRDSEHTIVSTSRYVKESPGLSIDSVIVVPTQDMDDRFVVDSQPSRDNSRVSRRSRSVRRDSSRNRGRSSSRKREDNYVTTRHYTTVKQRMPLDADDCSSRGRSRQTTSPPTTPRGRSLGARIRDLSPFRSSSSLSKQKENIPTTKSSFKKKKETTKSIENYHVGIRSARSRSSSKDLLKEGSSLFQKKKNSKIHHNILGRKIQLPPTGRIPRKRSS